MAQGRVMAPSKRELVIVDDAEVLAREAAKRVIDCISRSARPAVCLTGGSSPRRLYELLGSEPFRDRIPWDQTHWFIGDERFVPDDDPLSNMSMARKIFLDRLATQENVHAVPTGTRDPDGAARAYEADLRSFYGADHLDPARPLFDIVLLGVGLDGHVASLFPGAPQDDEGRWVVSVARANVAPFVPRVTMTGTALASCRQMVFLVSGLDKRAIFAKVQRGDDLPATHIHSNALTTWLVDRAAAGDAA
jgi:6-phosphogluconolactonase